MVIAMNYQTILVHASSGAAAEQGMHIAALLARTMGAHLIGSAPSGISRFIPPEAFAAGGPAVAGRCDELRRGAAEALARFEHIAAMEGVDSFESRTVDDDIDAALALQARYCDLVVVAQSAPGATIPPVPPDLPAYLLLTSGRPVLVVPGAGSLQAPATGAIVAWDGSIEAMRAVSGALPLLRAAGTVTVLGFGDEAAQGGSSMYACGQLAASLRRHGIAAHAETRTLGTDIGEALLSAATGSSAGVLVMGGYGHARFRERMLGGVTATILRSMTLPVLLAH